MRVIRGHMLCGDTFESPLIMGLYSTANVLKMY